MIKCVINNHGLMKKILVLTVVSVLSLHAFPQNRLVKYQGEDFCRICFRHRKNRQ